MKEILERLKIFNIVDIVEKRDDLTFFTVPKEYLVPTITHLRDIEGFRHLVLITAVDWLEDGKFQVTYILNNPELKKDLGIRVFIDRGNAVLPSVHHLWKTAATYQRELFEMFGIDFPGSPRVHKSFILEGWEDLPPYRRDFDSARYSANTYFPRPGRVKYDPAQYMKEKLYPGD